MCKDGGGPATFLIFLLFPDSGIPGRDRRVEVVVDIKKAAENGIYKHAIGGALPLQMMPLSPWEPRAMLSIEVDLPILFTGEPSTGSCRSSGCSSSLV
mmetsp:Transcript_43229/g.97700  ORF Transcript_43229/g.97700 Transcript_43229/m.97700 type:complete len:98 (+) Transcript_43229:201-494(+)